MAPRMSLKKDVSGNCVSMNTVNATIPKKNKGQCVGGTPAATSSGVHNGNTEGTKGGGCALYKKISTNSPNTWNIHPATDYEKWNGDGTSKPI